jgi:hypothetical protein
MFDMLDGLITLRRHLERENLPAERMHMSCGHLDTPLGAVPIIDQMPFPALVQPRAEAERGTFARFGAEMSCPQEHRALLETPHAFVDAPIVCLETAFVRVALHPDECVLTVGTEGMPGWTNQNSFAPEVFDYLESMAEIGGLLVNFADPFDRHFQPPEPEEEPGITWWDIRRKDVGECALALVKRPRERLILLLAIHQYMDPDEINKLNLAQVTQKFGRDYRARVYLKKRLVRKKAVAEALLQYRKRDRESFWYPKEPMFCSGKSTRGGRSKRMGAKAIEALLVRYAERALKTIPDEPTTKEPPAIPPRAAMFWIVNIAYHRTPTNRLSGG